MTGVILAVLVLSAAGGAKPGTSAGGCDRALPGVPAGLPAPISVSTRCGRFRLEPSGSVVFETARTLPVPRGASYSPQDLTWWRVARDHIVVGRGMRQLWRSHERYRSTYPGSIDAVVLGSRELAFSYYASFRKPPRLYIARFGGRERAVGRGETLLTFLDSGRLVTWRERGRALVLRAAGRFERLIPAHVSDVDRRLGLVLFRAGDDLRVLDGDGVRTPASLNSLGLDRRETVAELLGRLVAAHDRNRLVLLDHAGLAVASTLLPEQRERSDGVSSSVVANADETAIAFTATLGNDAYGSHGLETVYVLADGDLQARPLFREEVDFKVCERMAQVDWHGRWLLYSNTERRAVVVDSSAAAAPIELSAVAAQLPGAQADGYFDITWAGSS